MNNSAIATTSMKGPTRNLMIFHVWGGELWCIIKMHLLYSTGTSLISRTSQNIEILTSWPPATCTRESSKWKNQPSTRHQFKTAKLKWKQSRNFLAFKDLAIWEHPFTAAHTTHLLTLCLPPRQGTLMDWSKEPSTSETAADSPQWHTVLLHPKVVNTNIENIHVARLGWT